MKQESCAVREEGGAEAWPSGPRPIQNLGWVGHNAFGHTSLACMFVNYSQENWKKWCHQMPDFTAEMHQIRFPLGLREAGKER